MIQRNINTLKTKDDLMRKTWVAGFNYAIALENEKSESMQMSGDT